MQKQTLTEFAELLQDAKSIRQLNLVLQNYLIEFGIDTFAFTYYAYSPYAVNKLKYDFSSERYRSWHEHFIQSNYEKLDTGIDLMRKSILPSFWDVKQQIKDAVNPQERKMREDSLAFGVEKGISIPIHGPQEDFAILLLLQMRGQNWLGDLRKIRPEYIAAGYYYYNFLRKMLLKSHPVDKQFELTTREMQCLTLISKDYSTEDIAKSLHISERTVNHHIQLLNKKLGTNNKYQSVIRALQKGLIKL